MRGDESCSPCFLLTEFGMFVDAAPPCNELALNLRDALANFLLKVGHDRLRMRRFYANGC